MLMPLPNIATELNSLQMRNGSSTVMNVLWSSFWMKESALSWTFFMTFSIFFNFGSLPLPVLSGSR